MDIDRSGSEFPFPSIPDEVNGLQIPPQEGFGFPESPGSLRRRMGILLVELGAERSVAVMPVEGNQQPFGLLHGGASCVLGETLGSLSANVHAGAGRYAVGIDINATHSSGASGGWVTGVCSAVHLGGSLAVHEIVVLDGRQRRLSTLRITNLIRAARD